MSSQLLQDLQRKPLIFLISLVIIAVLVLAPIPAFLARAEDVLIYADNDSIMRYLSIRDWINGQSYYDVANYRVLPPEGIDLHWSRYLDIGVRGLAAGFGLFVAPDKALLYATFFWPLLMQILFLSVIAYTAFRVFGEKAAGFTLLAAILWTVTGKSYFEFGRIDHHNLQILLVSIVVATLLIPGRGNVRGMLGGVIAAFSLAIGLEMLLPLAMVGLILVVRTVIAPGSHGAQLRAYGAGLLGGALVFHAGQTHPGEWLVSSCDTLGPQVIGLTAIGAVLAFMVAATGPRMGTIRRRAVFATGLSLVALAAAVAVMKTCGGYPYGNLTEELRHAINTGISEALSIQGYYLEEQTPLRDLASTFSSLLVAPGVAWVLVLRRSMDKRHATAFAILAALAGIGAAGIFYQVRLSILAAPIVPLLVGALMADVLARNTAPQPKLGDRVLLFVVLFGCLMPYPIVKASYMLEAKFTNAAPSNKAVAENDTAKTESCTSKEALTTLGTLPKSRIFASDKASLRLLLLTEHDVLAAPYHRSQQAMYNALIPRDGPEEVLRAALRDSRAEYLVLCATTPEPDDTDEPNKDTSFAALLAMGAEAPGFTPVEGVHPSLRVFRIDF